MLRMEKVSTEKRGDVVGPQVHLAHWTRQRVFEGQRDMYAEVLAGHILNR